MNAMSSKTPECAAPARRHPRRTTPLFGCLIGAGAFVILAFGLLADSARATLLHVDVTGTFTIGPVPPSSFSGSFDLNTATAAIQHATIPSTPIDISPLTLTLYQASGLSNIDFTVGSETFTTADLVNLTPPVPGFPNAALYSGRDLAPGVSTDISLYLQQGSTSLLVGFVFCLTVSSFSCELDSETDYTDASGNLFRSFDTAVTVTGPTSSVPEPTPLLLLAAPVLLITFLRRARAA
jgi:hypothetical protein